MDTTIKYVGAFVPVLLIVWARYGIQALVMFVWLALSKSARFRTARPKFQVIRGALLLASSACGSFGVQYLPVAEFTAINMLTPVIVTLLAARFLNEPVSRLRWALVVGAFAGVLVMVRPGSGLLGWPVLFPLCGAVTYASFQTLTSKLAGLESVYTTHFYTGLVGAAILTPIVLASPIDVAGVLRAAPAFHLALMLLIGLLGTTGHLLLILALGMAPTSTLMPFTYAQIAVAACGSWLVFGHVPDGGAWTGMAIIAACGAASAWLNVRRTAVGQSGSPPSTEAGRLD
jgi:drug/metabolite transporter (DMT)-like permease